jgi:hypothetical protein
MEFKELVDIVKSDRSIKVYLLDRKVPTALTGIVSHTHSKRNENGIITNYIDLSPFVALFSFGPEAHVTGYITDDKLYNGFRFEGKYATLDYNYHKLQVMQFIDEIHKSGSGTTEELRRYFKLAKVL